MLYRHSLSIEIPSENVMLKGDLVIPENAQGIIIFVHGSGSSRLSPRNKNVASVLNEAGLGTLLFDLLTAEEEIIDNVTAQFRFDIPLLAKRLVAVTDYVAQQDVTKARNIGYFGASTGGGAALIASTHRPNLVKAVVSRGGRPDLAGEALQKVVVPTLLIVGGLDFQVIKLNQDAQSYLQSHNLLKIVPGATHLFEEPGTLAEVTRLATEWFLKYLHV
jgi:putative phosphoribosyl transferase